MQTKYYISIIILFIFCLFMFLIEPIHADKLYQNHRIDFGIPCVINNGNHISINSNIDNFSKILFSSDACLLKILFSFLKTWWFYLLYFIVIILFIYLIYLLNQKTKLIEIQNEKAKLKHETDETKLKFFTNVSHGHRNFLTLIYGKIEQLFKSSDIPAVIQEQLKDISNNAYRQISLINQVLSLRKEETDKIEPNYQIKDLVPFFNKIVYSFKHLSDKHNIKYTLDIQHDEYLCYFDQDKTEAILLDLLSNAFSVTQEKGEINIDIRVMKTIPDHLPVSNSDSSEKILLIRVMNSQQEIPNNIKNEICVKNSQSQVDSKNNTGTKDRLPLVDEFVKILYGTFFIEFPQEGLTSYTVCLPVPEENSQPTRLQEKKKEVYQETDLKKDHINELDNFEKYLQLYENIIDVQKEKGIMLIAEDNHEVRAFIVSIFKKDFRIVETQDGNDGFEKTLKHMPDIIISTIELPESSGLEFCNKVKHDEKTNHIPFVFLTSRISENDQLEGYYSGADDFITKPFNSSILKARIYNIMANRIFLQRHYRKSYLLDEQTKKEVKKEKFGQEIFLIRIKEIVMENLHKDDFSVERLADEMEISRSQLNRKIKILIGISPNEFIKTNRMNKAWNLLQNESGLSVTDIAYKVGYKETTYFSTSFKKHFGISPSEI